MRNWNKLKKKKVPIDIRITDGIMALEEQLTRPTMVSVNENITDSSASKQRAEKTKYLDKIEWKHY